MSTDKPKSNTGGAPKKYQQRINKIHAEELNRIDLSITTLKDLNTEVPQVIKQLTKVAKGELDIASSRLNAMKTIIQYRDELAGQLSKAAKRIEEENSEQPTSTEDDEDEVGFSLRAVN